MKLYDLLQARFSSRVLRNYSDGWRKMENRAARFESRIVASFVAAKLPETLAFRAADGDAPAEILLYDEIGFWGVTAKEFVLALASAGEGPLTLRINSPGGDVFDGLAIYNALRSRKAPVNVVVDGLAASAASFIAMAGSSVSMAEASMMMIHNAWGVVMGDRHDMAEMSAVMEKIDGQLASIYAGKSGKAAADIGAMMDAETWLTSTEAKEAGFCDTVVIPAKPDDATALLAFSRITKAPCVAAVAAGSTDPDDDDCSEAIGLIQKGIGHLTDAIESLSGDDGETDDDNPENRRRRASANLRTRQRAAATQAEWIVAPDEDLPIDEKASWDGPAAAERMLDAAGFNGDSPDPAKARRGFLTYDHHNPKLKGSYKLPFSDMVDGKLTAFKSGIDAAASRLPDTEIPDDVKARARAVIDAYEKRMKPDDASSNAKTVRLARLRVAEAEAA